MHSAYRFTAAGTTVWKQQALRKALKQTKYILACMLGSWNSYEKRKLTESELESKKRIAAAPVCPSPRLFVVVP